VVAVKVHAELFAAALSKRAIVEAGEGGKEGTSKPSVVDTKVSQSAVSKASLADVGLMVPSHERGFQKSSRSGACAAFYFFSFNTMSVPQPA
jgi:hypothetical protein